MEDIIETIKDIFSHNDFHESEAIGVYIPGHDLGNHYSADCCGDFSEKEYINRVKSDYNPKSLLEKMMIHDDITFGKSGYVPDGEKTLERTTSHMKESFKVFRKEGHLFVKDGIYKQIDGSYGTVNINGVDYNKIKR